MPLMRMAAVSRITQSKLLAMAQTTTEPKGAVLFRRNEPAFGVFLVRKGKISLRLETEEGKVLWHRVVTRDSIVGLPGTLAGGRYSLTAVTLQKSDLAFVSSPALTDLVKCDPGMGMELVRVLGDEVRQMRDVLASSSSVRAA
jgi:CRP-like cAMP-binding protein